MRRGGCNDPGPFLNNKLNLNNMKKSFYLLYAAVSYLIFFGTILYLIGFVSNLLVPKSIDTGATTSPFLAVLINIGLIILFGFQHSIMARQGFKEKWTRIVPEPIERSTYVLFASIAVILLLFFWQPIPFVIWDLSGTIAGNILTILSFAGWGMLFLSTFLINHFHLFGLQQVYQFAAGRNQLAPRFRIPFLYRMVRHPLYLGFLIAFWAAPVMTTGHLLFAISMTVYIFIGIYHEEKDLERVHGEDYRKYRRKTPKIIPMSK
jgi:protein-S-isoprenylcysteine O-methyltransferase Ste14